MFDPPKYRHFYFGIALLNDVPQMLDIATSLGAEFVTAIPTLVQVNGPIITGRGQPQQMQAVMLLMRCKASDFDRIAEAAKNPLQNKAQKAGSN